MNRSTAFLLASAAAGIPAFLVTANTLAEPIQIGWAFGIGLLALTGVCFWIIDRE